MAARRSGKTVGVRALIHTTALDTPHGTIVYVAPTINQGKRIIWHALMRDVAAPEARAFVQSVNRSELIIEYRNGCRLYLIGAERPERARGLGIDMLVVDEADDPNFSPDVFEEVFAPALSDRGVGRLVQVGSPKGRGRLFAEFKKGRDSDDTRDAEYASVQVTAIQAGLIPRQEIERARRLRSPRAFRQEYEASFESPAGVVYDEFDPRFHVLQHGQQLPARWDETVVGVDWGTGNRGAMLVVGLDSVRVDDGFDDDPIIMRRAWVLEEHSHVGMGYDDGGWWRIARQIQRDYQPSVWYADPAGGLEGYLRQLQNALAGSGRAAVEPANNAVRPGIATVREMAHTIEFVEGSGALTPRLFVAPHCEHTIEGFGSYRYRAHRTRSDEFTDDPVKESDHEMDALRYALHSHLTGPSKGRNENSGTSHGWG